MAVMPSERDYREGNTQSRGVNPQAAIVAPSPVEDDRESSELVSLSEKVGEHTPGYEHT